MMQSRDALLRCARSLLLPDEGILYDLFGGQTDIAVCTTDRLITCVQGGEASSANLLQIKSVASVEEGIEARGRNSEPLLLLRTDRYVPEELETFISHLNAYLTTITKP